MSDRAITSFKEYGKPTTSEYLRIRRLVAPVRAAFAAMDLPERYALLSGEVFSRALKVKRIKPPEYPSLRKGEDERAFRQRRDDFSRLNAAYRQQTQEYCDELVEIIVQAIEKLNTEGEFYDEWQKKTSSLQRAEGWMQRCTIPVFSALVLGFDNWHKLEPTPPPPPLPKGAQISLF